MASTQNNRHKPDIYLNCKCKVNTKQAKGILNRPSFQWQAPKIKPKQILKKLKLPQFPHSKYSRPDYNIAKGNSQNISSTCINYFTHGFV